MNRCVGEAVDWNQGSEIMGVLKPVSSPASASAPNPEIVSCPGLPPIYLPVVEAIIAKQKGLIGRILGKGSLASLPLEQVLDQFVQSREGLDAGCTTEMHPSEIVFRATIQDLVIRAAKTGVAPKRVKVYARFLAHAQACEEGEIVEADHAFRSLRESVGNLHGMHDGYAQPNEAEKEYRQGRQARQFVHSSAFSAIVAMRRLHSVLTTRQGRLPQDLRESVPPEKIQMILDTLRDLWESTEPVEDYLKLNEGLCRSDFSATKQAYILWHDQGPAHHDRWNDMHAVARAWRLTGIKDVASFRRYVLRICHGLTSTLGVPTGFARE